MVPPMPELAYGPSLKIWLDREGPSHLGEIGADGDDDRATLCNDFALHEGPERQEGGLHLGQEGATLGSLGGHPYDQAK